MTYNKVTAIIQREKLEQDPHNPALILTKVGIGYLIPKPT